MWKRVLGALLTLFVAASIGSDAAFAQVSAAADVYATGRESVLVVPAPGVLANDDSADSLAARLIAAPLHGDVVLHSDGSFEYTPSQGFEGRDSLTYVAQILKPIQFIVDTTETMLTLDAELKSDLLSASDRVSTVAGGQIVAYLLPGSPPFLEIHLTDLELVFLQELHLEFSTVFGSLLADVAPGNMMVSMLESGGAVTSSGTAFSQPENMVQLTATATLEGTGFLSSQVPPGDQDIIVDDVLVLEGNIRLEPGEEELRMELPIDFTGAFSVSTAEIDVTVTGTLFAAAAFEPPMESAETVVRIDVGGVGTKTEHEERPGLTVLHPIYPNPFNLQTVVSYTLRAPSEIRLSVFDAIGREVEVLVDGGQAAGTHEVVFDAAGLPGGVYFIRLRSGDSLEVRRAVLAK